jgi:hypothetical protein
VDENRPRADSRIRGMVTRGSIPAALSVRARSSFWVSVWPRSPRSTRPGSTANGSLAAEYRANVGLPVWGSEAGRCAPGDAPGFFSAVPAGGELGEQVDELGRQLAQVRPLWTEHAAAIEREREVQAARVYGSEKPEDCADAVAGVTEVCERDRGI